MNIGIVEQIYNSDYNQNIGMLLKLRKDFHAKCFGDDRGRLSSKALDQC